MRFCKRCRRNLPQSYFTSWCRPMYSAPCRSCRNKTHGLHPTDTDYFTYDGGAWARHWRSIPGSWHCPSCGRSKRDCMRWINAKGSWECPLHLHHDHFTERFPDTLICGGCNHADARAAKILGITRHSFSPLEMSTFVLAKSNGPVLIDKRALHQWNAHR